LGNDYNFVKNNYLSEFFVCLGITTVLTMTFLGLEARKDLPKVCSVCDFLCLDNLHWLHARWPIPLLWTTLSSSPLPISFQPSSRFFLKLFVDIEIKFEVRTGPPFHQAGEWGVLSRGAWNWGTSDTDLLTFLKADWPS